VDEVIDHYLTYDIAVMDTPTAKAYTPTSRTKVRRLRKRGLYDKAPIHAILDEGIICHVGFVKDGQPYVIPTLYARAGETLYIHGSAVSRMLESLADGVDICVTITLVDGYVLARSAFHHSMNYRSVLILGRAHLVSARREKLKALRTLTDHIVPKRWDEVRKPNELEMKQTSVLALPLKEVSAKVRTGPPVDDDEDYLLPVWAGVVPIRPGLGEPIGDGRVLPGVNTIDTARISRLAQGSACDRLG
jgi:uncharacterized protein